MVLSVLKSAGQPPHRRFWMAVCVLGLLGTTACNSLPTIVPDLALPSGPPPQLEGSGGPLSAAQSKAILSRLANRCQDTDIFARHLAIEEAIVGSPLTTGNQVLLLQDGPATYRAMYAAILAAQDHINMETYILDDAPRAGLRRLGFPDGGPGLDGPGPRPEGVPTRGPRRRQLTGWAHRPAGCTG